MKKNETKSATSSRTKTTRPVRRKSLVDRTVGATDKPVVLTRPSQVDVEDEQRAAYRKFVLDRQYTAEQLYTRCALTALFVFSVMVVWVNVVGA